MALTERKQLAGTRPSSGYRITFPTRAARPLNLASERVSPRGAGPTEGRTGRMAHAGRRGVTGSRRPFEVTSYPTTAGRSIIATTGGLFQGS